MAGCRVDMHGERGMLAHPGHASEVPRRTRADAGGFESRVIWLTRTRGMNMDISTSPNIDASSCKVCANRRPWTDTLAILEAQLQAHHVGWSKFVVMHGHRKSCADIMAGASAQDRGLYVVAVDEHGVEARHAVVFARKDPHYVGVRSVVNGSAFKKKK
jgi:hypothetical protein